MEVGIKEAQTNLSKLIKAAQKGQQVFLMNRNQRMVELVPVRPQRQSGSKLPGYGMFHDELKTPLDWGTPEAEEREEREILTLLGEPYGNTK